MSPRKDLQTHTLLSKYSRFLPAEKRRETHAEANKRTIDMHRRKFGSAHDDTFSWLLAQLDSEKILGSQRSLQFAGPAIERIHARQYNCAASFFDRTRFLAEAVWLLLCGCGVGFSVQKHHVAKLPTLRGPRGRRKHFVDDSIEGWADAFDALLNSYVHGAARIDFVYDRVRPEGAPLSTSSAKAPGPKPLEEALENVRRVLDRVVYEQDGVIRPIDAYDIVMHAAMCVRAGGIRRSATICIFSPDDVEMAQAKTGNWFAENPQRRLSNNSAMLVRAKTTRDEFAALMSSTKQFGEPGFYFSDSTEHMPNPCQPAFATVLTKEGIRTFADIDVGSEIWSETGWTKVVKKWSNGIKPVRAYRTTAGVFVGTDQHRVVEAGVKVEAANASGVDVLVGPRMPRNEHLRQAVIDGLMCGGGMWHKASKAGFLCVGQDDIEDYANCFGEDLEPTGTDRVVKIPHTLKEADLPLLPERQIPSKYLNADQTTVASFLRGLYSANGSVVRDRVTLKLTSPTMRDQVQTMLSSIGIRSYFTTNKSHDVEFANGTYTCKESYDINITTGRGIFAFNVGFIHARKNRALEETLPRIGKAHKSTYDFVSVEDLGEHEVFDITVDNAPHTYWTGGVNVSNCVEIGLDPVDHETGETTFAFCNVTSVNCAGLKDEADLHDRVAAAATLGTFQAAYTDFAYLGAAAERVAKRDALLGVSLTGMADAPSWIFEPEVLREAALCAVETNWFVAGKLGINTAARVTTVKPEGTGSLMLGVGNGIHPHHSRRYLRHVEGGKWNAPIVKFMLQHIPQAVVQSAYNDAEVKLVFPIDLGDGPLWLKAETEALDHLAKVATVQKEWVRTGRTRGEANHNVSNTVVVKPHEWGDVEDYIWNNRDVFAGVSLLGSFGDLDYPQAPFVEVLSEDEAVTKYGDDPERLKKAREVKRIFDDLVAAWPKGGIPWGEFVEDEDASAGTEVVACAGGNCSF